MAPGARAKAQAGERISERKLLCNLQERHLEIPLDTGT